MQLIVCTAGALLYLFLLAMLAGMRRPKLVETLVFLSGVALFLIYAGRLLALNVILHYDRPPRSSLAFAGALMGFSILALPPLLVHAHAAYWQKAMKPAKLLWTFALPILFYLPIALAAHGVHPGHFAEHPDLSFSFLSPVVYWNYSFWLGGACLVSAFGQASFCRATAIQSLRNLHLNLAIVFAAIGALAIARRTELLLLAWLLPGVLIGYYVVRNRFLAFGVQRTLLFTVTAAFLALIYIRLTMRVSEWLKDQLPPEATVSIFLFLPVIFFEPIQRVVSGALDRAVRRHTEQFQRLMAEIQQAARNGNLEELLDFAETRIRETLGLASVRISLQDGPPRPAGATARIHRVPLRFGETEFGAVETQYFGQLLSGETAAALEYLAEQLPAAIDLCRLLEEKLKLERELAEHERLALLGQMAASVSHNLRNPLGSMKTLLQVQQENPQLPSDAKKENQLLLAEIERLSATLTQLLDYSRPDAAVSRELRAVDVAHAAESAVALRRHDAERKQISLEFHAQVFAARAQALEEALSDVLANLISNALEAAPEKGSVRLSVQPADGQILLSVEDDGPGVPAHLRERIFEPFFTTKARGTGLGLSIVARRVHEMGGRIACESPVRNGHGTRFTVSLRAAGDEAEKGKPENPEGQAATARGSDS